MSELNIAVGTLNHGTQQNSAMVEESTAASNELAAEVHALNQQLLQFRTDDGRSATGREHVRSAGARDTGLRVVASNH